MFCEMDPNVNNANVLTDLDMSDYDSDTDWEDIKDQMSAVSY